MNVRGEVHACTLKMILTTLMVWHTLVFCVSYNNTSLNCPKGMKFTILVKRAVVLQSCFQAPNRPSLCKELL